LGLERLFECIRGKRGRAREIAKMCRGLHRRCFGEVREPGCWTPLKVEISAAMGEKVL